MPLTPLPVPSPERAQRQGKEEIFTEHNLGTPFNTVTDGTDTGMVGLTQEGSTAPTSLLNLTHATIPSFKQAKESTLKTNADPTDVIVPVPALQKQATDSWTVYTDATGETTGLVGPFPTDRDNTDLLDTGDFPVSG